MKANAASRIGFDRAHLIRSIGAAADPQALRAASAPLVATAWQRARDTIRHRFMADGDAAHAVRDASGLADELIATFWELAGPLFPHSKMAVLAVGGYGRRELFPYSDIDLLFLCEEHREQEGELAQWVLYGLWDLGLAVGHSVRTLAETMQHAQEDVTIRTNLLDARFLCGDEALARRFREQFDAYTSGQSATDFVERKLAERDARHQRCGDSRYVLEPNIKEGKGGLRDLQMLMWMMQYIYQAQELKTLVAKGLLTGEEATAYAKARDFLWRVRMHLHYIAGRGEERLTFDMQRAVAEALGYHDEAGRMAVERFMKDYFVVARIVGNLTRSICAVLEEEKKRKPRVSLAVRMDEDTPLAPFRLEGERLALSHDEAFEEEPLQLITLFRTAHEHEIDIHPRTLQLVTRSLWLIDSALRRRPEANEAFMDILLSRRNPEPTLRRMSDAGVLGRFIPDFGRVIGQMQFDMYHVYTVDEHTLNAIGILHGIETGKYREEMPAISSAFHLIKSRRVLYLSLLAHDIAKGRGGDHSVLGETVVRKLARRFQFSPQEAETCAWLVRYHLLMSRTAFKRDTNDPKTIEDFVALVQSPERLRLLLALTVADIRAVGPTVWNGWKGALLRDLYYRSEAHMGASDAPEGGREEERLRADMATLLPDWTREMLDGYLSLGHGAFWLACNAETHAAIARMLRELETGSLPLVMSTSSNEFHAITDVIICAPDQQGLFSKLSGAIALAGANIVGAKIFTLKNGVAVDMFHIQDIEGRAFDKPDKLARLAVYMNKALAGELDITRELAGQRLSYPSRMDVFKVPPRVFIENKASAQYTVIEVGGRDRIGFLHGITRAMAELGLSINTAHISTYGERAVDVFYVKDVFGMKIHHERRLKEILQALELALSAGQDKQKAGA